MFQHYALSSYALTCAPLRTSWLGPAAPSGTCPTPRPGAAPPRVTPQNHSREAIMNIIIIDIIVYYY